MLAPNLWKALAIAACCWALPSCDPLNSVDIQGAGATFPAPVYKRWFLEYYHRHSDVRVNYQAIGSGAGIRQFTADLVEFGASDAAMSDKEIAEAEKKNPRMRRSKSILKQLLEAIRSDTNRKVKVPCWPCSTSRPATMDLNVLA